MRASMELLVGSTNLLEVGRTVPVTNQTNGLPVNDATVTATLYDDAGVPVTGTDWPVTLTRVPDADGVYRAVLPHTLALVDRARYRVEATIEDTGGNRLSLSCAAVARQAGCC